MFKYQAYDYKLQNPNPPTSQFSVTPVWTLDMAGELCEHHHQELCQTRCVLMLWGEKVSFHLAASEILLFKTA